MLSSRRRAQWHFSIANDTSIVLGSCSENVSDNNHTPIYGTPAVQKCEITHRQNTHSQFRNVFFFLVRNFLSHVIRYRNSKNQPNCVCLALCFRLQLIIQQVPFPTYKHIWLNLYRVTLILYHLFIYCFRLQIDRSLRIGTVCVSTWWVYYMMTGSVNAFLVI